MNNITQEEYKTVLKNTEIMKSEIDNASGKKRKKLIKNFIDTARAFNKIIENKTLRIPASYIIR